MKYEVSVKISPSYAHVVRVVVNASNTAEAIVQACLKLDEEGKKHWNLLKVVPVTN